MAENKKSFLLYADMIHQFEQLEDQEAGKLIKTIFQYINDMEPEPSDRIIKIAFEPIKRQLKRDLKDWEQTLHLRSEAGILGNLKRWHNDIYLQLQHGKITLEDAINQANNRKKSGSDKSNRTLSQSIAKIAVNVNDTVNVTVNDTHIPALDIFLDYLKSQVNGEYIAVESSAKMKYKSWVEGGWKDGNGKKIVNWKTKLLNTIPYLKREEKKLNVTSTGIVIPPK